jgi:hypothetical protein
MLDWLTAQKTDHPMHSIEEAERLLSGLSDEPRQALDEVASWLTTIAQAAGLNLATRLAVTRLVDETGQPFEPELIRLYLAAGPQTEFERMQLWQTALHFRERAEHAYRVCFDAMQQDPKLRQAHAEDFALLIVRMLRAQANQARLLRLRYIPVREGMWQALYDLYRTSETAGYDNRRVTAYPGDAVPTTARYELLRAAMLDTVRPDSMLPRDTELAARITARYSDACLFDAAPKAGCNWAVDLAAPRPPELAIAGATVSATVRFFGAGAVMVKINEVIRRLTAEPGAKEQRFGADYTAQEKLAVLQRLASRWGEHPPQRSEERRDVTATVAVTLGIAVACLRIPRAQFRGWRKVLVTMDAALLARLGITADPAASPAPETWVQHDASTWGMGAAIPRAAEPVVTIGTLCALKSGEELWWVGVVRRLYRDSEERLNAGIEVLARKPATVLLRRVAHAGLSVQEWSKASDASGADYLNVILLAASRTEKMRHELLLPRGEFIAGLVYEAMLGDDLQHFKLEELLEQGEDFERVRFTRVSGAQMKDGAPA